MCAVVAYESYAKKSSTRVGTPYLKVCMAIWQASTPTFSTLEVLHITRVPNKCDHPIYGL